MYGNFTPMTKRFTFNMVFVSISQGLSDLLTDALQDE